MADNEPVPFAREKIDDVEKLEDDLEEVQALYNAKFGEDVDYEVVAPSMDKLEDDVEVKALYMAKFGVDVDYEVVAPSLEKLEDDLQEVLAWYKAKFGEDEENKSKIEAKNDLENYCFTMRNTLQEEKLKEKFEGDDKDKMEKAVQDTLDWLDKNQLAEKGELEAKQKELEGVVNPIRMKVYEAMKFKLRKDIYATVFNVAPASQDYLKQSNTYLHVLVDKIVLQVATVENVQVPQLQQDDNAVPVPHVAVQDAMVPVSMAMIQEMMKQEWRGGLSFSFLSQFGAGYLVARQYFWGLFSELS